MNDLRSDVICKIIYNMMDGLNDEQISKLKNTATIVMNDYEVRKRETSLTVYSGNEIEYLVKKFLIEKKVQGCTDRTIGAYGKEIPKILYKINKPLKDITSDDILIYIANRDIKDKISKTTQDNELRFIRTFFAFLIGEEYITKNPCLKIKAVKGPKLKKKAFTDIEIERIRSKCKNNKEKALIETLLSTGCRVSEIVQIKHGDIVDGKIDILGKGQKMRMVYLNAKAQIAIENYTHERKDKNEYLFPKMLGLSETSKLRRVNNKNYEYKDPCFITENKPAISEWVEKIVRNIGKRAGVDNVHPHRFRRTCATTALRRGMPLIQVSKMLGHENVGTTQIYLDITENELE